MWASYINIYRRLVPLDKRGEQHPLKSPRRSICQISRVSNEVEIDKMLLLAGRCFMNFVDFFD